MNAEPSNPSQWQLSQLAATIVATRKVSAAKAVEMAMEVWRVASDKLTLSAPGAQEASLLALAEKEDRIFPPHDRNLTGEQALELLGDAAFLQSLADRMEMTPDSKAKFLAKGAGFKTVDGLFKFLKEYDAVRFSNDQDGEQSEEWLTGKNAIGRAFQLRKEKERETDRKRKQ